MRLPIVEHGDARFVRTTFAPLPSGGVAPPDEVKIRLLQPCDLRCSMCWHWQDPERGRKQLSFERVRDLLAELGQMGVRKVKLTGGEPTLRPDLPRIVESAAGHRIDVTVATNAYGLTAEKAERLVGAGVRTFHVSLDGGVAEVHDAVRGIEGAFARTVAALEHLRDLRPRVGRKLAAVVQRRTVGALTPLVPLCARLGIGHLYLLCVHTEPWCHADALSRGDLERYFFDELPVMFDSAAALGVRLHPSPLFGSLLGLPPRECAAVLRGAREDSGRRAPFEPELDAYAAEAYGRFYYARRPCAEIQSRAEVAETGHVYPCCHTEIAPLSMGNIHDEPFDVIWSRARYRAFRSPDGPLPHHPRCLECKDGHTPPIYQVD